MSAESPEPTEATSSLVHRRDRGALSSRGTLVSLLVHAALVAAAVLISHEALRRDDAPRVQVTFFEADQRPPPRDEPEGGGGGAPEPPAVPPPMPVQPRPRQIHRPQPTQPEAPPEEPWEPEPLVDPMPAPGPPDATPATPGTGTGMGSGTGTGVGSGSGSGIGSGNGPGVGSGTGSGGRPIYLPAGMSAPRRTAGETPQYTRAAREAHFEGEVIVRLEIAPDGSVRDVRVLRGHPLLDDEIVRVLRQWHFTPPLVHGVPTSIYLIQRIGFEL